MRGGVPLVPAKSKQSGVTPEEISGLIAAFEKQNDCRISIEMRNGLVGGKESLELYGHAWNNRTESTAAPLLGSVSLRCSGLYVASLEGAIIRLLYALDSQLAWGEMGSEKPK